jgi:hypothetical protein
MAQTNPIIRVTPGTPVYERDGSRVGKVGEVRGEAFRVETGLFQRDYWLPADAIDSAVAGDAVMLAISKGEIGSHKIEAPTK